MDVYCYKTDMRIGGVDVHADVEAYLDYLTADYYDIKQKNAARMTRITLPYSAYTDGVNFMSCDDEDTGERFYYYMTPAVVTPNSVSYNLTIDAWDTFVAHQGDVTVQYGRLIQGHKIPSNDFFENANLPFGEVEMIAKSTFPVFYDNSFVLACEISYHTDDNQLFNNQSGIEHRAVVILEKLNADSTLSPFNNINDALAEVAWFQSTLAKFKIGTDNTDLYLDNVNDVIVLPTAMTDGITTEDFKESGTGYVRGYVIKDNASKSVDLKFTADSPHLKYYIGNARTRVQVNLHEDAQKATFRVDYHRYIGKVGVTLWYNRKSYDYKPALSLGNFNIRIGQASTSDKIAAGFGLLSNVMQLGSSATSMAQGSQQGASGVLAGAGNLIYRLDALKKQSSIGGNVNDPESTVQVEIGQNIFTAGNGIYFMAEKFANEDEIKYFYGDNGVDLRQTLREYDLISGSAGYNKTFWKFERGVIVKGGNAEYLEAIEAMLEQGVRIWVSDNGGMHFVTDVYRGIL